MFTDLSCIVHVSTTSIHLLLSERTLISPPVHFNYLSLCVSAYRYLQLIFFLCFPLLHAVLDALEYAAYAHDVQHVILDNLQFMMSGAVSAARGFDKYDLQERALDKFRYVVVLFG